LNLRLESPLTLPGSTFYSDNSLGNWAKPTGIYLPPGVDVDAGPVNVLLYLHGWYVDGPEHLFNGDRAQVRKQVLASGKSVALVAPYLGKGGNGTTYAVDGLKGRFGEIYLTQILNTLALMRDPDKFPPPWQRSTLSLDGLTEATSFGPHMKLGKLVIGCHSGGGEGMRYLVESLGRYKGNLAECWGFDCLYGENAKDAKFWFEWVTSTVGRPLFVSYGKSTVNESVKLDLMRRGLVDQEGARRDPKGAEVAKIDVKLGITAPKPVDDLMGLPDLLKSTEPKGGRPSPLAAKFAASAATNMTNNAPWPVGKGPLMEMHYRIARDGLLERLKGAGFF
jgi:hypothetical protein